MLYTISTREVHVGDKTCLREESGPWRAGCLMSCAEPMTVSCASLTTSCNCKRCSQKLLLEEMPKNDKTIIKNDKYIVIKKALESKEVEVEIEFLLSIKPIFDDFLTRFQKEEPMIHRLHSNCEQLLKTAMGKLMQSNAYVDKRHNAFKEELY